VNAYVLDASALMTFFEDRAGAGTVEELLAKAAETKRPLAMSMVNWGEVFYPVWRPHGEKQANARLREIAQLPIEIVGVDLGSASWPPRLRLSTTCLTRIASLPLLPEAGRPLWLPAGGL
jgi:hypothetical protein